MLEIMARYPGEEDKKVLLPDPKHVINLTGRDVMVLDGYGEVLKYETKEMIYKQLGTVKVQRPEVEAVWPEVSYLELVGLANPEAGFYYLVENYVAEVAWRKGRYIGDLLVPTNPAFLDDGKELTLLGYTQIVRAEEWLFSFL